MAYFYEHGKAKKVWNFHPHPSFLWELQGTPPADIQYKYLELLTGEQRCCKGMDTFKKKQKQLFAPISWKEDFIENQQNN